MYLFASVPTHSGQLFAETVQTIVGAQSVAHIRGWAFSFHYTGGTNISAIRNIIAATFLKSGADLLLMIDSDQATSRTAIEQMIGLDKPVVGCIAPKRKFNPNSVRLEAARSVDDIFYQGADYVGELESDEEGVAEVRNGFARAVSIGAGIMLVRRHVFERLMECSPELEGRGFEPSWQPALADVNWGFFNSLEREDGFPLSEDLSFCRRWRATGGEIWADVQNNSQHIGRFTYAGNYLDFLKATSM
jgi:hypothetical protein